MKLTTPIAYLGMLSSASIANHLGYCAMESQLEKNPLDTKKKADIASRTFENLFVPHFAQKIVQTIGNKAFGDKIGSALSSYGSSLVYMIFHKALTADVNHEISKEENSYVPDALPSFYQEKIRPAIKSFQEKVLGLKEDSINYFKLIGVYGAMLASTFLDKDIAFPGTQDIRNASGLGAKLIEAVKNKLIYIGTYFTYQATTLVMYGKRNPSGVQSKLGNFVVQFKNAIKTKSIPPLSIAIADPLAELITSLSNNGVIPAPFLAACLRVAFMFTGGKIKAAK